MARLVYIPALVRGWAGLECKSPDAEAAQQHPATADSNYVGAAFGLLPGLTRSVVTRDYAVVTAESQVIHPLAGWSNTTGAIVISPAMGGHFVMYLAFMRRGGASGPALPEVERFVFVIKGEVSIATGADSARELRGYGSNAYAYFPSGLEHTISAEEDEVHLVVFERKYVEPPAGVPRAYLVHGKSCDDLAVLAVPGEDFALRKLLPPTDEFDFNIHIMDFEPGEYLNVKEVWPLCDAYIKNLEGGEKRKRKKRKEKRSTNSEQCQNGWVSSGTL